MSTKLLQEGHKFMTQHNTTPVGIIEGFFGRSWSYESRCTYAKFLAQHQFDFYIYAPKNDIYLRHQWQQDWPKETKKNIHHLRHIYAQNHIAFGIGLSPLNIWHDTQNKTYSDYKKRLRQLNDLSPDILCILFDDMRGDLADLAKIQTELTHIAADISKANKIIEFFWTGEKVCSEFYSPTHLQKIQELFQRKVFLWDNYPVNDGAIKSKHLHLLPVHSSHADLAPYINGHAANPMNQAHLSQIPLLSLTAHFQNSANSNSLSDTTQLFIAIAGEQLGQELFNDAQLFQTAGLNNMDEDQKRHTINRYQAYLPNPLAKEVIDWLQGEYTFDPACLTE